MNGRYFYKIFASVALLCILAGDSFAADQAKKSTVGKTGIEEASGRNDSVADADSPGVQLARQHLAELLPLLSHLRTHEPGQYDKAIREFDRAAKRLEGQQRRGDEFYDIALRQWQSRGRIDLLKAKLRVRSSESDRKRLLAEMQSLREVEVQRLRLEWEVLVQRQQSLIARMAQAEAASKRAEEQMEELNQNIQRLSSQQIDSDWPPYRRAAGLDRDPESAKKSNTAETIKPNPGAIQRMNDAKI